MPHSTYLPEKMGTAVITPNGAVEAGSFQSLTLVYTAGYFGIDDTGAIKIVHRFASDMGKPQWTEPRGENFVTAEASNGAVLDMRYDPKLNIRPWDKTLMIRVMRGFLREGDTITVRFGDRRQDSVGMRMQTFVEPTFEFRVLVDAFATYNFVELPVQPTIPVVAGPPVTWKTVLPTLRRCGERFRLGFKGEDKWGNPSDAVDGTFRLRATSPVNRLPQGFIMRRGERSKLIEDLSVDAPGDLVIEVLDEAGRVLSASNLMRIAADVPLRPCWCDLHGQSEETIGTNSARELIEFARDHAFLDGMSHQGNDFQITSDFWTELNGLTQTYNEDGRFIIFPGYEWSGNTGLGGDRNVMFMQEGRQIRRSSHALVDDLGDELADANSAEALFAALKHEDCVVFAHIGGRYADIKIAHDARIERSVEIHSDWGTFEWLLHDAFDQGYRVGILANSDGHKGRHGASHPGASLFGAYGGLSCLLAPELTRAGLFDALRRRHHYATTGCRTLLNVEARFRQERDALRRRSKSRADSPNANANRHDGRYSGNGCSQCRIAHRGRGAGADRTDRNPQRQGRARGVAALRRGGAGQAHPDHLGRLGIPRPWTSDSVGWSLHAVRKRIRADCPDQFVESRQETRIAGTRNGCVDGAYNRRLRRV